MDSNLYYKVFGDSPLILVLYIDELFLTGAEKLIVGCNGEFSSEFEMKDLGLKQLLQIRHHGYNHELTIHHTKSL